MYERDSCIVSVDRAVRYVWRAVQPHFAAVRHHHPADQVHHRAFPGAVLPDQSENFAVMYRQRDVVDGADAEKGFAQVLDVQRDRHVLRSRFASRVLVMSSRAAITRWNSLAVR